MVTFNDIYTVIRNAVKAEYPSAYCTSKYEPVPSEFPAVYVSQVGRSTPQGTITFSTSATYSEYTIQIQIFSNKTDTPKSECDAIYTVIKRALEGERLFVEKNAFPLENADTSIYRFQAQFTRLFGDGDAL